MMVGASKILTVSYGTFSCTLEGFDEPFSTMKAIAEYFRDLAADDRYFGAEPPTPDAEMLHRIAEREVQRRVEAKIQDNGILLRADAGVPAPVAPVAPVAPPVAAAPAVVPVAAEPVAEAEVPEAEVAEVETAEVETAEVETAAVEAAAADSAEADIDAIDTDLAETDTPADPTDADRDAEALTDALAALRADATVADAVADAVGAAVADTADAPAALAADPAPAQETAPTTPGTAEPDLHAGLAAVEALADDRATRHGRADAPLISSGAAAPGYDGDLSTADLPGTIEEDSIAAKLLRIRAAVARERSAQAQRDLVDDRLIAGSPALETATEDSAAAADTVDAPAAGLPAEEASFAGYTDFDDENLTGDLADVELPEEARAHLEERITAVRETQAKAAAPMPQDDDADADAIDPDLAIEAEPESAELSDAELLALFDDEESGFDYVSFEAGQETGTGDAEAGVDDEADTDAMPEEAGTDPAELDDLRTLDGVAEETAEVEAAGETAGDEAAQTSAIDWDEDSAFDDAGEPVTGAEADEPAADADTDAAAADMARVTEAVRGPYELPASARVNGSARPEAAPDVAATPATEAMGDALDNTEATEDDILAAIRETQLAAAGAADELPAEDEADLMQALAEAEAEDSAVQMATVFPEVDREDDEDVTRILETTNSKLEKTENRRRFSAIAHLKAAVAATVADRKIKATTGETSESPEVLDVYRDDLAKVVGPVHTPATPAEAVAPRRPVAPGRMTERPSGPGGRPSPLVLVSEQRIDRPAEADMGAAIRPRRVSASSLAMEAQIDEEMDEVDDDEIVRPETSPGFAAFARKTGATDLTDLLEAAAAYTSCVEGLPHFSRPQIMRRAAGMTTEEGFTREAGLRSFGMLLRQGKIQKLRRGQFTIAQSSRYVSEARTGS